MDLKDKKILSELENNAKLNNTTIGKIVGLSSEGVSYRIKNLEKNGIIKQYMTYVDFNKLGFTDYGVYFSLDLFNEKEEENFISYIKNHPNITYFGKLGGEFDYVIGILVKNPIELNSIIDEINKKTSYNMTNQNITIRLELIHFSKKYLFSNIKTKNTNNKYPYFGGIQKPIKLTKTQFQILKEISNNARENLIVIAKKLNLPYTTLISQIKKLEKEQIIINYFTIISEQNYNYQHHYLLLKNKFSKKDTDKKIQKFFSNDLNSVVLIKTIGAWDYEVGIDVKNQEELQNLIHKIRINLPELKILQIPILFKTLKYSQFPFKFED